MLFCCEFNLWQKNAEGNSPWKPLKAVLSIVSI